MLKIYTFYDNFTGKTLHYNAESETEAWIALADKFGSGYVFENICFIEIL